MKNSSVQTQVAAGDDARARWLRLMFFAAFALVGNSIASTLRYPDIGSAVLFPPYAVLTAALVVSPRRDWIWYFLICGLAHFSTHWPQFSLTWVLGADVANMTRSLVAALLLIRLLGIPPRMDNLRQLALFFVSAGVVAPAVGATIGATNMMLHHSPISLRDGWNAWFVSNALAGLTILPALVAAFGCQAGYFRTPVRRARAREAWLLLFAVVFTCAVEFLSPLGKHHLALPLYGSLPVLIWAATRFGTRGASAALTMIELTAIWSVDRGAHAYPGASTTDSIIALQLFVFCAAVPILCLAALATGRERILRLHRALLASLQDQVAILDANGAVVEANESWRRGAVEPGAPAFHRARVGDAYLRACEAAIGDPAASSVVAGVVSVLSGAQQRFELEYTCAEGGSVESYVMIVERLARPEGGAVVTCRDVTARRRAQKESREQRNQLLHLSRVQALGHLSGAFAHELHQPLTAIRSNAEVARTLIRQRPANLQEISEILDDIVNDDERASDVIERLRSMLKRREVRFQEVCLGSLINEVLALARSELIARHVEATAVVEESLPQVWGDRVQLQQVLLNLILNACEAMSTSSDVTDRKLMVRAEAEGLWNVHIVVRDSGTGIPDSLLESLFQPFVTTRSNGLGLGLSISETIIAAHGGRLWAENNADAGATVHCLLPVKDVARPEIQAAMPAMPAMPAVLAVAAR
jgi:signal transduction histidine kinase/integral membrane sensor domain MASE1